MAVKIRLARYGSKKRPFYRVVVADSESPRDGRFIEVVGHYDPLTDPPKIELKKQRLEFWMDKGAIPTETVRQLIKKAKTSGKEEKAA